MIVAASGRAGRCIREKTPGTPPSPAPPFEAGLWHLGIPVVSTEAPLDFARGRLRAEWRDLLSTIGRSLLREGLSAPRFALRSRRRKLAFAKALPFERRRALTGNKLLGIGQGDRGPSDRPKAPFVIGPRLGYDGPASSDRHGLRRREPCVR